MSSESYTYGLGRSSSLLRSHVDFLQFVGAVEGSWQWADAPDGFDAELRRFRQSDYVEITHIDSPYGNHKDIEEYRLTEPARSYLRQIVDERDTMCPCGHSGIENRGDHYECGFGPCSQRFDRDELEVDA